MIGFENGRSCVPPATRRRKAAGFCASYFAIIHVLPSAQPARNAALNSGGSAS